MGNITDAFRNRLEKGEDRNSLMAELALVRSTIKCSAGFRYNDSEKTGNTGRWDLDKLTEETHKAENAKQPTPLQQLKDAEIATVYMQFLDMDNPTSKKALENALKGKTTAGALSESALMQRQMLAHAHAKVANTKPTSKGCYQSEQFRLKPQGY